MRHRAALILLPLLLIPGCSHNPSPAEPAQVYRTKMTRAEATQSLGKAMRVEVRPANGWPVQDDTAERIGAFAGSFERKWGATVQTCEVYSVLRGSMDMGLYQDYLFYGSDDRLLGFHRRFLD